MVSILAETLGSSLSPVFYARHTHLSVVFIIQCKRKPKKSCRALQSPGKSHLCPGRRIPLRRIYFGKDPAVKINVLIQTCTPFLHRLLLRFQATTRQVRDSTLKESLCDKLLVERNKTRKRPKLLSTTALRKKDQRERSLVSPQKWSGLRSLFTILRPTYNGFRRNIPRLLPLREYLSPRNKSDSKNVY